MRSHSAAILWVSVGVCMLGAVACLVWVAAAWVRPASPPARTGGDRYKQGGNWNGTGLTWDRRGGRVVFAGLNRISSDLYAAAVGDVGMAALTATPHWERNPVASPTSDALFYVSDQDDPDGEWYAMGRAGQPAQRVAPGWTVDAAGFETLLLRYRMQFSPDGRQIAFPARAAGGTSSILVGDASGQNIGPVSPPGWFAHSPVFDRGGRVVFVRRTWDQARIAQGLRGAFDSVWSMEADGSDLRPITPERAAFIVPFATAPDDRILYLQNVDLHDYTYTLCIMGDDGSGVRVLARGGPQGVWEPVLAPAGDRVFFLADVKVPFHYDLCVVDLATGSLRTLTNGSDSVTDLALSPDGRQVAFLRVPALGRSRGRGDIVVLDLESGQERTLAHNYER